MVDRRQQAENILDRMSIDDRVYLVGVFVRGVTVLKQQIRALNLVWALKEAGQVLPASSVAVIGGGFAGLTAAAALLSQRIREVYIFERRAVFCPLQQGCDTRWLHPHVYEWPAAGTLRPVAGLPVMNWREGRASDVTHYLLEEWRRRRDAARHTAQTRVVEVLQLRHLKLNGRTIEWVGLENDLPSGNSKAFDVIIVATGFGEESAPPGFESRSYWRNESINQPQLADRRQSILVSGTGDGGFIDLLRARLDQFRQDAVIDEVFGRLDETVTALRDIYVDFRGAATSTNLFERFSELPSLDELIRRVRSRLRRDTDATLQVKSAGRLSAVFGSQASFLNNLMVFLLYRAGGFTVQFGELSNGLGVGFDLVIVRHGTDRDGHFKGLFGDLSRAQSCLERAKARQDASEYLQSDVPLWPAGWWDRTGSERVRWQQEYAPAATVSLASAFVSSFEGILSDEASYRFRVTLHRVMDVGGERFLQQAAYYGGTREKGGEPYRAFPLTRGLIGHCARTARAWRTWKPEGLSEDAYRNLLDEDIDKLELIEGGAQPMDREVYSLLALPLLRRDTESRSVVAVLFVDSTGLNVFTDATCLRISAALGGFAKLLDRVSIGHFREIELVDLPSTGAQPLPEGQEPALRTIQEVGIRLAETRLASLDLEWSRDLPLFIDEVHAE